MSTRLFIEAAAFFAARLCATEAHEIAHELAARLIGHVPEQRPLFSRKTVVPTLSADAVSHAIVRHSGWLASVAFALLAHYLWADDHDFFLVLGIDVVALEAVCSDLLRVGRLVSAGGSPVFYCGNFGLLLLEAMHADKVLPTLTKMLRVTSMRGAQSAGLVTYTPHGGAGLKGTRKRVVNGKRTDLTTLLLKQCKASLSPKAIHAPQVFQGHTRFATTSIAALPGCHPHQWSAPSAKLVWMKVGGAWVCSRRNVEAFITHNGDLEFYTLHGTMYSLGDVQKILVAVLHSPLPASVDSICVAGLLDLLRTAGMWHASTRFGYVFGALKHPCGGGGGLATLAAEKKLWGPKELAEAANIFEAAWVATLQACPASVGSYVLRAKTAERLTTDPSTRQQLLTLLTSSKGVIADADAALKSLVEHAVDAFFDQGLLAAAMQLLDKALGSFGLVLSTSLDADGELIVAARGQTMSLAFYPECGLVLWGSESAATKAGMMWEEEEDEGQKEDEAAGADGGGGAPLFGTPPKENGRYGQNGHGRPAGPSVRLDMDDVNGEVVQLRWGASHVMQRLLGAGGNGAQTGTTEVLTFTGVGGVPSSLLVWTHIEGRLAQRKPLMKRMLQLHGNPLVQALPALGLADPVAKDLADLPAVLRRIKEDWNEPAESLNRMTAFTLSSVLRARMRQKANKQHDGSLDILIAGCEVSLWLGEQFASDMHLAFPSLSVECISANKLLGLLGQRFAIPQSGFRLHSGSYNLRNTIVLLISHSGGTFATLNCSYLLKAFTRHIFVVTSEWDTQVARSVRAGVPGRPTSFKLASYIFTTFCGMRPAEACSLTVAATHQLLTQILLHLMYVVRHYEGETYPALAGSTFDKEEVCELETLDQDSLKTIHALIHGTNDSNAANTRPDLLAQGRRWADHVLEGPISWIISALYIAITVIVGATPLSSIVGAAVTATPPEATAALVLNCTSTSSAFLDPNQCAAEAYALGIQAATSPRPWWAYLVGALDAALYIFLPIWTTWIIRLIQGRPWLHRVAGRSVLIGDVPWVAQSLEAYVSKLFALSYSIASLSVASANPSDHLVHRHTHRVVRGSLLAVGRPDGRLNALSASENTICLAVNQASSIQNYGVTCESITLGHNPSKLPLTANTLCLPRLRPRFFSEHVIEQKPQQQSMSAAALMGTLTGVKQAEADEDDNGINDYFDEVIAQDEREELQRQQDTALPEAVPIPAAVASKPPATAPTAAAPTAEGPSAAFDPGVYRKIPPMRKQFIGAWMAYDERYRGLSNVELMDKQFLIQTLYETRMQSLHRFVGFLVLFHAMAKRVSDFWRIVTFGVFQYDMSRTQSIMRIATTASPVSGMEVREKTIELQEETAQRWATNIVQLLTARWLCFSGVNNRRMQIPPERVQAMLKLLYSEGGSKYMQSGQQLSQSFNNKGKAGKGPNQRRKGARAKPTQYDSALLSV